eukprot:5048978-Prymnesium_polylepis.1
MRRRGTAIPAIGSSLFPPARRRPLIQRRRRPCRRRRTATSTSWRSTPCARSRLSTGNHTLTAS